MLLPIRRHESGGSIPAPAHDLFPGSYAIIGPDGKVHKKLIGYQEKSTYLRAIRTLKPELAS